MGCCDPPLNSLRGKWSRSELVVLVSRPGVAAQEVGGLVPNVMDRRRVGALGDMDGHGQVRQRRQREINRVTERVLSTRHGDDAGPAESHRAIGGRLDRSRAGLKCDPHWPERDRP